MEAPSNADSNSPRSRPLEAIERRVLGVLIEKAKTTPENYPLSLNALRAGCNQKNNRAPLMQLEESQIEEALDGLRRAGAIALVQGDSRVDRYRHLAYQWLGVEKVELAVMAELLLRGAQTVGELRGRAARMEPIKDLSELTPVVDALVAKGLVIYLTPPGRGSIVSHALYLDREMDKVRREAGALPAHAVDSTQAEVSTERAGARAPSPSDARSPATSPPRPAVSAANSASSSISFAADIAALREELNRLKQELAAVRAEFESTAGQVRRDLDELNRQLGN
jgi:uncharacterized protein YceH (UPF0502 family)